MKLDYLFGQGWEIIPAGGATGEAFFAIHNDQKLFLKRNASPFIAVLSAEGIVPKLVWTKRLESGDVITAQEWLAGRELKPADMRMPLVGDLLSKIHQSKPLLTMLKRIGKQPYTPFEMLMQIETTLTKEVVLHPSVQAALSYLDQHVDEVYTEEFVVCHGDLNHNNWLLTESDQLYLIDWEGAVIADRALDLSMILYWYVERDEWTDWLNHYGLEMNENLLLRLKWYMIGQTLLSIQWSKEQNRDHEVSSSLDFLEKCL